MKITVIGAGHGGQTLAAYLSYHGVETAIYNRTKDVLDDIEKNHGLSIEGILNADNLPVKLFADLKKAVNFADIIVICVPATAHGDIAKIIAPYISSNHIILLVPGRTIGACYFKQILCESGVTNLPVIAETDTFFFTSRTTSNGNCSLLGQKKIVYLASFNESDSNKICALLNPVLPMIVSSKNLVYTSLSNIGVIFHPIPTMFNICRIEANEEYLHYIQGITPTVCCVLERLDEERLKLGKAFGVDLPSAKEWLYNVYGSEGDTLYERLQATYAYSSVKSPTSLNTRYIYEDLTTGLVPMYCMAKKLGTPYSVMETTINMAKLVYNYDFYKYGRTNVDEFISIYR